jgi:hypothetical protein
MVCDKSLASMPPKPRLGYASRSWLHGVCSRHKAPSAMQKRTCTRAAGGRPGCCVLRMVYDGGGPAPPL